MAIRLEELLKAKIIFIKREYLHVAGVAIEQFQSLFVTLRHTCIIR